MPNPTKKKSFSEFFLKASDKEQIKVFTQAAKLANQAQRKIMNMSKQCKGCSHEKEYKEQWLDHQCGKELAKTNNVQGEDWERVFDNKFLFKSNLPGDPAMEMVNSPNIIQDSAEIKQFIKYLLAQQQSALLERVKQELRSDEDIYMYSEGIIERLDSLKAKLK